jgi:NNP family nitrate/nitrite transporter-like MFS transporter
MLFAWSFASFAAATPIFYGLAAFFAFNVALNCSMYARLDAANPC